MTQAPTTGEVDRSAELKTFQRPDYTNIADVLRHAIQITIAHNGNRLPLMTVQRLMDAQGFDRESVIDALNYLTRRNDIKLVIELDASKKPFKTTQIIVCGGAV
ncbi:MAG: hypothetical protein Q7W55_10930 [Pseudohongiella sp.]|nr:hypothetical protein [Pseudohongiella sp.]